jgi:hypothetical protein
MTAPSSNDSTKQQWQHQAAMTAPSSNDSTKQSQTDIGWLETRFGTARLAYVGFGRLPTASLAMVEPWPA